MAFYQESPAEALSNFKAFLGDKAKDPSVYSPGSIADRYFFILKGYKVNVAEAATNKDRTKAEKRRDKLFYEDVEVTQTGKADFCV
jgi:hypothetical protein